MSINTTNRKIIYTGNGTASTFAFAFKAFLPADLYVAELDTSGALTVLVLNTDFSVSLNGNQETSPGGSVTLLAGNLAAGILLAITTDIAELQQVVLTNLGGFYPDVINAALDRLTIFVQQLQNQVNQSIKFGLTDDLDSVQLPPAAERAGKFLYFGPDGAVQLIAASTSGIAVFAGAPTGMINGTNRTFSVASSGSLVLLFYNGTLQQQGVGEDYTISGTTITMANAPVIGDNLYALIFA